MATNIVHFVQLKIKLRFSKLLKVLEGTLLSYDLFILIQDLNLFYFLLKRFDPGERFKVKLSSLGQKAFRRNFASTLLV